MEWLSQNWTWILVLAGALWLLARYRGGALRGTGHGRGPRMDGDTAAAGADGTAAAQQASGQPAARSAESGHRHRGGCC